MHSANDQQTLWVLNNLGEPFKDKKYLAEGWFFRSIPWMDMEGWKHLREVAGEHNIKIVRQEEKRDDQFRPIIRVAVIINPDGMQRVVNYEKLPKKPGIILPNGIN